MVMRRGILGLLALLLVCAGAPAQAASTYGWVTGINGVLYDDCRAYPYAYSISPPSGAGYWALSTTLVGPDGREAGTDYVAQPSSGTSTFRLCTQVDPYGSYTIRAQLTWGPDLDHPADYSATLDDAHFTMRKPLSRTSVTASTRRPAYGQLVTYRFRSLDEQPGGYAANAFAWVHLEKRVAGRWVRVKGGRAMTHSTGAVKVRLRYLAHHRRTRLRAVTEPSTRYTRSVSPTLRLW
jgi:hypothetical protein